MYFCKHAAECHIKSRSALEKYIFEDVNFGPGDDSDVGDDSV